MPIYDYVCACGERFEALLPTCSSPAPTCARCGGSPVRRPSAVALLGKAKLSPTAAQAPSSWLGTHRGNSEYIAKWRRALDARAKLEEDNPELAHRSSPVVAHEGRFHNAPLTANGLSAGADRRSAPHVHTPPVPKSRRSRRRDPAVSDEPMIRPNGPAESASTPGKHPRVTAIRAF